MTSETKKELLECVLTHEELIARGDELAHKNQEKSRLEAEKKAITSEFSAKINACEAVIEKLGLAISTRRESREVEVETRYNEPEAGQKTFIRKDTNAIIKIVAMTQDENDDMFINALGDQEDMFVFRDRRKVPIVDQSECSEKDHNVWKTLGQPATAENLVAAPIEAESEYRVIRGENENGDLRYIIQKRIGKVRPVEPVQTEPKKLPVASEVVDDEEELAKKAAGEAETSSGSDEVAGAPTESAGINERSENDETEKVESGERDGKFHFPDGRVLEVVNFDDVKSEAMEAFKRGDILTAGVDPVTNKTKPYKENELLAVIVPDFECKVIKGGMVEDPSYYLWTFPDKKIEVDANPAETTETTETAPAGNDVCGHRHADGRTCQRPKGHDGRHTYPKNAPNASKTTKELLEGEGLTIGEAETYLQLKGRLGMTQTLIGSSLEGEVRADVAKFAAEVKAS